MTITDFDNPTIPSTTVIAATIMDEPTIEGFFNDLGKSVKKILESVSKFISEDLLGRFKDMLENVIGKRVTKEAKHNLKMLEHFTYNVSFKDYALSTVQGVSTFTLRIDNVAAWALDGMDFKDKWKDTEEQFRIYVSEFISDAEMRKSFSPVDVIDTSIMKQYEELDTKLGNMVVDARTPTTTVVALFGNSGGMQNYINACKKLLKIDLYNEVKVVHTQLRSLKKRLDLVLEVSESTPVTQEALKSFAEQTKKMANLTSLLGKIFFITTEMITYPGYILDGIHKELKKKK